MTLRDVAQGSPHNRATAIARLRSAAAVAGSLVGGRTPDVRFSGLRECDTAEDSRQRRRARRGHAAADPAPLTGWISGPTAATIPPVLGVHPWLVRDPIYGPIPYQDGADPVAVLTESARLSTSASRTRARYAAGPRGPMAGRGQFQATYSTMAHAKRAHGPPERYGAGMVGGSLDARRALRPGVTRPL